MSIIGKKHFAQSANLDGATFQKAIPEPGPFPGSQYFIPFASAALKIQKAMKGHDVHD